MGNVFKSVAKFLDNALSGGEVDVIVMEEKPLDASAVVAAVAEDSSDVIALENAGEAAEGDGADGGSDNADAANTDEAAADEDAGADGGEAAANADDANADGGEADANADADANAGETQSIAAVLGAGQVAISAADLEALRADAGKWNEHSAELEQLREWKANSGKPNLVAGAADAADVVAESPKKVSAATQKAIDLKNKMAGN